MVPFCAAVSPNSETISGSATPVMNDQPLEELPRGREEPDAPLHPGQGDTRGGGSIGPERRLVDVALDAAGLGPPIVTLKIGFGGHDRVSLHAVRGASVAPSSARQCRQYRRTLFRDRDVASASSVCGRPGGVATFQKLSARSESAPGPAAEATMAVRLILLTDFPAESFRQ